MEIFLKEELKDHLFLILFSESGKNVYYIDLYPDYTGYRNLDNNPKELVMRLDIVSSIEESRTNVVREIYEFNTSVNILINRFSGFKKAELGYKFLYLEGERLSPLKHKSVFYDYEYDYLKTPYIYKTISDALKDIDYNLIIEVQLDLRVFTEDNDMLSMNFSFGRFEESLINREVCVNFEDFNSLVKNRDKVFPRIMDSNIMNSLELSFIFQEVDNFLKGLQNDQEQVI